MKEKGWWTAEAEDWQTKRVARLNKLLAAWKDAEAKFKDQKDHSDAAWIPFWTEYRGKVLASA